MNYSKHNGTHESYHGHAVSIGIEITSKSNCNSCIDGLHHHSVSLAIQNTEHYIVTFYIYSMIADLSQSFYEQVVGGA